MIRALLLGLLLALTPGLALAHAQLIAADPADGSTLAGWPAAVTLTFSEGVSPLVLRWIAPDGSTAEAQGEAENEHLRVRTPSAGTEGSYLLSWRVTSADGHPVGGVLTLHLGAPSARADLAAPSRAAEATAVARFLLSLALVVAVGAALHGPFVAGGATSPATRRLGLGAALLSLPTAGALAGFHGLDLLGLEPGALLTAAPWQATLGAPLARTVALSVLSALLAALALSSRRSGPLALAAWLLAAVSFAASGHAVTAPPVAVSTLAMVLHGIALVWWMGLLVPLLHDLHHPEAGLRLRRFSTAAVPLVALLALSGAWLIWVQTAGTLADLTSTTWGRLLMAKLALVGLLLALAILNRLRLTPALAHGRPAPLARSIRAEIALGLLILALAAGFRLAPPPRALIAPAAPVVAHLHSDRAMADLRLTPGRAGPTTVEMAFQTGAFDPLEPRQVDIALTPADGRLEPLRARAERGEDGLWRAGPLTIPFPGDWEIAVRLLITDFEAAVLSTVVALDP